MAWHAVKINVDVSAERLVRNRSTLFRKLRRDYFKAAEMAKVIEYFGVATSMKALVRRAKNLKRMRHAELRRSIIKRTKNR